MIELRDNGLEFYFPAVCPETRLRVEFMRTLRIPDDGKAYSLPPGLGKFPLRHVDDFAENVPREWMERGGVLLPMYQSEALWLCFHSEYYYEEEWLDGEGDGYPFAVKIATGKINAISGEPWSERLSLPQDYIVLPDQPWLDGFCVKKGHIRQFVAIPLGSGYSVEEQITGKAEYGGLQIAVYPMKKNDDARVCCTPPEMPCIGLSMGGLMEQEVYEDNYGIESWDLEHKGRCFIHIANSLVWRAITGENPPTVPFTAKEYTKAGMPWFEYYTENAAAVEGSKIFEKVKSVHQMGKEKGDVPLPENESVEPKNVIKIIAGSKKSQVREGNF